ncbi:MAG: hypothetical protein NVS4B8_07830 [Herpetosiphon sp.]
MTTPIVATHTQSEYIPSPLRKTLIVALMARMVVGVYLQD